MSTKDSYSASMSLSDIDENLVFSRFGTLVRKKDLLYSDYIQIDEPDEIGTKWVEFSSEVVQDLLNVVNLTKSLFERLVDELRRGEGQPSSEELERIKHLTEFWLDLSVISYLYSTIEKRGVLDQPGLNKYTMGYVDTKKSLDELTLLAFQAGQDFFTLQSRIVLGEALSLNMEKKLLDFAMDLQTGEDIVNQTLGGYDKNQALFLMNRVFSKLLSSSSNWWFLDPIGLHSASEHAISHITSMREHWSKSTSDLVEKGNRFYENQYHIATITSNVSLAQHYRKLAIAALETRSNDIAAEYFREAAELVSAAGSSQFSNVDSYHIWNKSISEQELIYKHMMILSKVSVNYDEAIEYLKAGNHEEILLMLPQILSQLSEILSDGDIPYVSSVAVAYETVFVYIKEQLEQGISHTVILSFVENRLHTVGTRLHKASHQLVAKWINILMDENATPELLDGIVNEIDYPLFAVFILPPHSDLVEVSFRELLAVQRLTEAIRVSLGAEVEFGKNPVKEMLMRAKTFELVEEALEHLNSNTDKETKEWMYQVIEPVKINAFLRGLIAEIQLRTAVLQYKYINRVAPIIESSSLNMEIEHDEISQDLEELINFTESLEELSIASQEVNKHQMPIQIGGAPLNWSYIAKLEAYSLGLVDIFKSVNSALRANATPRNDYEDAIMHWDGAKTLAFQAAEKISLNGSPEAENISQEVYSMAQLFYEFENKKRERKEIDDFPVDGVVELISSILMGL